MLMIDGNTLTIAGIVAVARHAEPVGLAAEARQRMQTSQEWVRQMVAAGDPVYGINTGFGIFADQRIPPEASARLSRNLILSHAVATGPDLPAEVVRAAMLIRANTLAAGYSGPRPELVETLLEMLNHGVTPAVPSQGSLGSSGDLAPLSHLALVFSTDFADLEDESGFADFQGQRLSGKAAMACRRDPAPGSGS